MSYVRGKLQSRAGKASVILALALVGLPAAWRVVVAAPQGAPGASPPAAPNPAVLAHVHAEAGPYAITLGFTDEPAVAGEINNLMFEIVDKESEEQVEGIDKVYYTVTYAGTTQSFTTAPAWGQTSVYEPRILPMLPGNYLVDITFTDADGDTYTVEDLPRDVAPRSQYAVPATQ